MSNELPASVDHTVRDWLQSHDFGSPLSWRELGGSSSNTCFLVDTDKSLSVVAKVSGLATDDRWLCEADGLKLLAASDAIRTPDVLYVDDQCLLLEYIPSIQQSTHYWTQLAEQLAQLHATSHAQNLFGLESDNYCGDNRQHNGWHEDGFTLFGEHRLLCQARLAYDNGYLESPWIIHIETICERLPELIPLQPCSLIHGDLWPGNILVDDRGLPALIDPAAHYGWREADIAMSLLFGGLPHDFYCAYEQAWPMEPDWRKRVPLYNLYHLLNHLNIFGVSYLDQVHATVSRYA